MPQFSIHVGIYFAGGSGSSSFPSPYLTLISQELAADKNSPSRSLDKSSRARRFNLLGTARAQRNTPVSSRYFIAPYFSFSSLHPGKQRERRLGVGRQNPPQSSSGRSQCRVPDAPSGVLLEPSAPPERHDW